MIKKNDKIVVRLANLTNGKFSPEQLASYPGKIRTFPSFCKISDHFLYLMGGLSVSGNDEYMNTCLRYSVEKDIWEDMPFMNEGRMAHSSCFLEPKLYVFGGRNADGVMSSIESLKITLDAS